MYSLCVFLVLVVTVLGAPQQEDKKILRLFDIKPASNAEPLSKKKAITSFEPYEKSFEKFKAMHGKTYHSVEEETYRKSVFKKNALIIEEHNKQYSLGRKTYYLGINQFADMEHWEFKQHNGFLFKRTVNRTREGSTYLAPANVFLPDKVDWRTKGYVTPVKNQGQCGSCWSFSTTGSLEGQHFRKTGKLLSLSEQQLVDCSGSYGDEGCNGGLMDDAFKYIEDYGLESESVYPYHAKDEKCKYKKDKVVATCTGFVDVTRGSEEALKSAVGTVGPVSVAIDASHQSFQLYSGGVYNEEKCSSSQLDHGVLVVGYGTDTESSKDYWLVKNSWGESWGQQGYIMMSRNNDNQCGIASQASYPEV